ncbi:breast cancer type 1 susceptibility protein homolog [Gordionus sp. m RMFG-2023]|uniref:breast cancer type 1 susceptibility protein homolog n=1 Tax=Gordionus sp. m RMFG-2023 TaxID=3053472 RepID=UPI0031FBA458
MSFTPEDLFNNAQIFVSKLNQREISEEDKENIISLKTVSSQKTTCTLDIMTDDSITDNNYLVASPCVSIKRETKPLVLITSGLAATESEVIHKFLGFFNATLLPKYSDDVTHVIVKTDENLKCERTLKYFLGVAGKKWVMSMEWARSCLSAMKIIDEEYFEVRGDTLTETDTLAPKISRLSGSHLRLNSTLSVERENLLSRFQICCFGNFTVDLPCDDLKRLIALCGARLVNSPSFFKLNGLKNTQNMVKCDGKKIAVIVAQTEANPQLDVNRYNDFYRRYNAFPVAREWIFDCVALYDVVPLVHYLHCQRDILKYPDLNYATKMKEE